MTKTYGYFDPTVLIVGSVDNEIFDSLLDYSVRHQTYLASTYFWFVMNEIREGNSGG